MNASVARPGRSQLVDGLAVVPATLNLAGAEVELVSTLQRENRLKSALAAVLRGLSPE